MQSPVVPLMKKKKKGLSIIFYYLEIALQKLINKKKQTISETDNLFAPDV